MCAAVVKDQPFVLSGLRLARGKSAWRLSIFQSANVEVWDPTTSFFFPMHSHSMLMLVIADIPSHPVDVYQSPFLPLRLQYTRSLIDHGRTSHFPSSPAQQERWQPGMLKQRVLVYGQIRICDVASLLARSTPMRAS
jgi:hypothetical protein